MQRRLLGLWIAGLLLASATTAVARVGTSDAPIALETSPGTDTAPTSNPATVPTTTITPTTTAAAAPAATSAPRVTTPTTTAKQPSALVRTPAVVDQPGLYAVRRDGTGLRRVLGECRSEIREWVDADEFVTTTQANPTLRRVRLDGQVTPFPLPVVTGPSGQQHQLQGFGSPSPEGTRMVLSFGGANYGVAIVDLAGQTATAVLWGDNPTPTWSPSGEILLVGPSTTTLIDASGATLRAAAPSPIAMGQPWLLWSPDGRQLLAASASDWNRWMVMDPRTNTSRTVPFLGQGRNDVAWAGSNRVVIAEPGIDHGRLPTTSVWDLGSGKVTKIADGAYRLAVPVDGQVVAFEDWSTHRAVGLVSIDGSRRSDLLTVAKGLFVAPHSWSPDGTWLLADVCADTRSGGSLPTT